MKFTTSSSLSSCHLVFPQRPYVSALLTCSSFNMTCREAHQRRSMCKYYQSFLGRDRYGCDVGLLIYSTAESAALLKNG